jgi:hypothetical protein
MTGNSTLDPENLSERLRQRRTEAENSLGPSDSSDSGSDLTGTREGEDAGDRFGTGERASVDENEPARAGADVDADRVVDSQHAGLGGGLDQAEEARLGTTDEKIASETAPATPRKTRRRR